MSGKTNPAVRMLAIDVSSADYVINPPCRAVVLGVGGTLEAICTGDTTARVSNEFPAGLYPLECSRINTAGTTADEITLLW